MNWVAWIVGTVIGSIIGLIIGLTIGHIMVSRSIGEVTVFRLFNRIHRYIYVPLFRKKWTSFDECWYDLWEQKAKQKP